MSDRTSLQSIFEEILGSNNVYFQPPESIKIQYPAIIYKLDKINIFFSNDYKYLNKKAYEVTLIDKNPDSIFIEKLLKLKYSYFDRHFVSDNLNHYVFTIFY